MEIFNKDGIPTKELYFFLRYNQISGVKKISGEDEKLYNEFCRHFEILKDAMEKGEEAKLKTLFGSVLSMFGFSRHYCSTCGQPIVGRYSKIGNRVACEPCFESYRIIQQMGKKDELGKDQQKLVEKNLTEFPPIKK